VTDESNAPAPAPEPPAAPEPPSAPAEPSGSGPSVSESWDDVVARMKDLGDAISGWAHAAADNPENREHLDQVRQSLGEMSAKAAETFAEVAHSDFGKSVAAGASQAGQAIGDAATTVGQAAAPHVASAFAGLADVFGKAAQHVSEQTARQAAPAASAEGEAEGEAAAAPAAAEAEPPAGDAGEGTSE